jgi:hypothetical protein
MPPKGLAAIRIRDTTRLLDRLVAQKWIRCKLDPHDPSRGARPDHSLKIGTACFTGKRRTDDSRSLVSAFKGKQLTEAGVITESLRPRKVDHGS